LANVQPADRGSYDVLVTNAAGSATSTAAVLAPNDRGLIASQAQATTAGLVRGAFTIEGAGPKQMLVRAVGPTLANFGVAGFAVDPKLSLVSATTAAELAANDDWSVAANAAQLARVTAEVGAYPLTKDSKDAAVLATLAPGTYRVNVGSTGAGGTVILEIYDADATPRLVYVATQARVGAAGFSHGVTLFAAMPGRSYLIRALGPALGIADALGDPTLAVYAGATQLAANDNWGGDATLGALGASAGAMPLAPGSADAALRFEAPTAGVYSVRVGGVAGAQGVALLEIFEVDAQRAATVPLALVAVPTDVAVRAGRPAGFGVIAVGRPQPTYQWSKAGVNLTATNNTLALSSAQVADAGVYTVRVTSGAASIEASATLAVEAVPHSADTNRDGRIGLLELTRVIELYNTRHGTTRTGAYAVSATNSEDGFTIAPARAPGVVEPLARHHTGDVNRDAKISLVELTRVIELYNVRTGTTRTGQYRVQPDTEDGFAPGP
jgi:hypothetical protein